jgi:hypothetical protein
VPSRAFPSRVDSDPTRAILQRRYSWSFLPLAAAVGISLGWDPLTQEIALNFDAYRAALRDTDMRGAFLHSVWLVVGRSP